MFVPPISKRTICIHCCPVRHPVHDCQFSLLLLLAIMCVLRPRNMFWIRVPACSCDLEPWGCGHCLDGVRVLTSFRDPPVGSVVRCESSLFRTFSSFRDPSTIPYLTIIGRGGRRAQFASSILTTYLCLPPQFNTIYLRKRCRVVPRGDELSGDNWARRQRFPSRRRCGPRYPQWRCGRMLRWTTRLLDLLLLQPLTFSRSFVVGLATFWRTPASLTSSTWNDLRSSLLLLLPTYDSTTPIAKNSPSATLPPSPFCHLTPISPCLFWAPGFLLGFFLFPFPFSLSSLFPPLL
ncbi:hypothetical protein DL93DRAFT_679537 [Clavulina sp. PMI_390]|nr:hypothetical protein DL93DRAFT_679537 [Clavulina sp. PMI_390]